MDWKSIIRTKWSTQPTEPTELGTSNRARLSPVKPMCAAPSHASPCTHEPPRPSCVPPPTRVHPQPSHEPPSAPWARLSHFKEWLTETWEWLSNFVKWLSIIAKWLTEDFKNGWQNHKITEHYSKMRNRISRTADKIIKWLSTVAKKIKFTVAICKWLSIVAV
jgi:hypothetical protein